MNPQLNPQSSLAPVMRSDQGHNLPLYPVDLLINSRAQWYMNYSFMAHNWAQDWGFIGHKPSGGLLRPGLKPLPGPQVQLEQMELNNLFELLL